MAISNDTTGFADLKARLDTLNCDLLLEEGDDGYFVFDRTKERVVARDCGKGINDIYDWVDLEEKERSPAIGDDEEPLDNPSGRKPVANDWSEVPDSDIDNPIRAFLLATKTENCHCGDEGYERGRSLVDAMAAQIRVEDDEPTLPLSVEQCADVLTFTNARSGDAIHLRGGASDEEEARYGGDPGFGLFLIVNRVSCELRRHVAATEVAHG